MPLSKVTPWTSRKQRRTAAIMLHNICYNDVVEGNLGNDTMLHDFWAAYGSELVRPMGLRMLKYGFI